MSVLKTLRETIAPELNHLYVVPPSEASGKLDFGWHDREHALHAFLVARMFGAPADIRTGDFAVLSRFVPALTSLGGDQGHAWCNINDVTPVDLSLTFQHYGAVPQLRSAIVGEGRNGDWEVQYAEDESLLDEDVPNRNEILFIEKKIHEETAAELVANPQLFLPPPRVEDSAIWSTLHGTSIYAKITLHCFECATGSSKSVRNRLAAAPAVAWIAANYPDAESRILAELEG
ncbi:MAG: hypothetical protein EXS37_18120 [Opitutus sp.]|nr:hypothetical protein [Opitutus sp.]